MTFQQLYDQLEHANKELKNRQRVAHIVLRDKELMPLLLQACYRFDDVLSRKACWTLEFVYRRQPYWLLPFMDEFIANLSRFKIDGCVRPIAKITRMLVTEYFRRDPSPIKEQLTDANMQKIAEVNFDWLITDEKVAVKSYAIYNFV